MVDKKLVVLNHERIEVLLEALVDQQYTQTKLLQNIQDGHTHFRGEWHHKNQVAKRWAYFGAVTSILSMGLMAIAALHYPEETRTLFETLINDIKVWKNELLESIS